MDTLMKTALQKLMTAHSNSGGHDNRYYTKTRTDGLLNGKAPLSHTHTKSQITDFPTSLPASDVYSWAKASSKPSYSWSEITDKPSTFTPASHTHDYLPTSGGTISGTLILSKTTNASVTSYTGPALVVGGQPTSTHLEIDGNKILAKSNETTVSDLYLNINGGSVRIGIGGIIADGDIKTNSAFIGSLTGNADTSTALTTSAGAVNKPVFFSSGKPVECYFELNKSVPNNAVFTDTTYDLSLSDDEIASILSEI